jgi:hypothetical protein
MPGMKAGDTHHTASQLQVSLMRAAGPRRRLAVARSLTRQVGMLSRRALRRRNPDASSSELDRAFAELHYGDALVRRLLGES